MRLNKYIANAGICSRRKADKLIENGSICINGEIINDYSYSVNYGDIVIVDGIEVKPQIKRSTYILHKPSGFVSSNHDMHNSKKIFDLIETDIRLFSIGRLDIDTTGIILITNDGDLSYKLSHPKFQIEKKYTVYTNKNVDEKMIDKFAAGLKINNEFYKAKIKRVNYDKEFYIWDVVLNEGKNREIKKIFKFLGAPLFYLHRYCFAGLELDYLKEGESRLLSDIETNKLYKL